MMKPFLTRVAKLISRPVPFYIQIITVGILGTLLGFDIAAALMAADRAKDHWLVEFGEGKGLLITLLSWAITLLIAYWIYHQFQRKQVRIARFTTVSKLEEEMLALHAAKTARRIYKDEDLETTPTDSVGHELELRFVLDDDPWVVITESPPWMVGGAAQVSWRPILGQRFWTIREGEYNGRQYTDLVSSKACHEVLSWFRKVSRAHREKIIADEDLVHLWQQILPLAYRNRLSFMKHYFHGEESIREFIDIIQRTRTAVEKSGRKQPLEHFGMCASKGDMQILEAKS